MSKDGRKFFGYSEDDEMDELESKLVELASEWRRTKDNALVTEYHQVFNKLMELGWKGYLDADAELPKGLMPQSYFNL